ncbi:MAG: TRL-like family protein [Odoribacter sp.]
MKRKFLLGGVILAIAALMSSCAVVQSPVGAWAYVNVKGPVAVTSNSGSSKVGTAECQGILGLVATGDASIQTAAKSAGISRIHHVDYESSSILGIIGKYKVVVYGE